MRVGNTVASPIVLSAVANWPPYSAKEVNMSSMVDWEVAVKVAAKMAGDGPVVSKREADAVVAELRAGAERSTPLVREFTGLVAAERTAPVLIVDRAGWIRANADAFAKISEPLLARFAEKMAEKQPSALSQAVGSRVAGAEIGLMLGFLSSKILGQFDPFYAAPGADGRLMLVAPNIVHIERELDVDPHDFRLWVCLHEETHRVQFTAVPWMRDHLFALMQEMLSEVKTDPQEMLSEVTEKVADLISGKTQGSLMELFATPRQRELLDQITGVMSLLEGHADVVMDGVGPSVIPSVEKIRAKFTERRKGMGMLDKIIRRLLGLDQKMAQYRDGAIFVRYAVDKVGMAGFNRVWERPENLPSKAEILDPQSWLDRVHGPKLLEA